MSASSLFSSIEDLPVELEQEVDGRWIAEIVSMPGVMVNSETKDAAIQRVKTLALEVLLDRNEQNDVPPLTLHCDLC